MDVNMTAVNAWKGLVEICQQEKDVEKALLYFAEKIWLLGGENEKVYIDKSELRKMIEKEIMLGQDSTIKMKWEQVEVLCSSKENALVLIPAEKISKNEDVVLDVYYIVCFNRVGESTQISAVFITAQDWNEEEHNYKWGRYLPPHFGSLKNRLAAVTQQADLQKQEITLYEMMAPCGIFKIDWKNHCSLLEGNQFFYKTLDYTPEQMKAELNNHLDEIIWKEDLEFFSKMIENYKDTETKPIIITWEMRLKSRFGALRWLSCSGSILNNDILYGIATDISSQKQVQFRYEQELRYRETVLPDMIVSYKVNLTRNTMENYQKGSLGEKEMQIGETYDELMLKGMERIVNEEEKNRFYKEINRTALLHAFEKGKTFIMLEYRRANAQGRISWVCTIVNLMEEPSTKDIIAFLYLRNIDEKKKLELALTKKVEQDSLTGVYNRATLESLVTKVLMQEGDSKDLCAILLVDIDNFRRINDSLGHLYGDEILSELGRILKLAFDSKNIVGRAGSDEFVIFLANVVSQGWVLDRAEKLCEMLNQCYLPSYNQISISGSIGVAVSTMKEATYRELYKKADKALYAAKQNGKNRCYLYHPGLKKRTPDMLSHHCIAKDHMARSCVLDELEDMVVVIDMQNYAILFMNRMARIEFEYDDSQNEKKKCYEVIQGLREPCPFCDSHLPNNNSFQSWKYISSKWNRRYMVRDKMVLWDGRGARIEFFNRCLPWDNAIITGDEKASLENMYLECICSLVTGENLEKAVMSVLNQLGIFYQAERTFIIKSNSTTGRADTVFEWCAYDTDSQKLQRSGLVLEDIEEWLNDMGSNGIYILHDAVGLNSKNKDIHNAFCGNRAKEEFYFVPLVMKDNKLGYLGIENPTKHQGKVYLLDTLAYFLVNEITKRKLQDNLQFLSYHDVQTGLLNRNCYLNYLSNLHEEAISSLGVFSADINGLKKCNQEFGHDAGDKMLKMIANVIQTSFKDGNVYRFAGDEFLAVCQDVTYSAFKEYIENFENSLIDKECVSYGYTWTDTDIHIEQLVNHADELMMIEKQKYYKEPILTSRGTRPYAMKEDLITALNDGWFYMFLQPKVEISTGKVNGAEALVRCIHPEKGLIAPDKFVPALERVQLIRYIDFFIFEEVCRILKRWQEEGRELITISLNFSRSTLLEIDMMKTVLSIYEKYQVPKNLIEIEITESLGDMERETVAGISKKLTEYGFGLSLDDFGSKYSSVSILSIMSFDVLKLDKSIVNDIVTNQRSRIIVKNIISTCKELQMKSIAEGVETTEQLTILQELGCTVVQGYLFNKPIPYKEFETKYLPIGF